MTTKADQIEFMQNELAMREESYPIKVKMGRMSEKEATLSLELTRAVLESLEAPIPEPVPPPPEPVYLQDERYMKIEPVLVQIYQCAHEHANVCVHCGAVGNILEEVGGFSRNGR